MKIFAGHNRDNEIYVSKDRMSGNIRYCEYKREEEIPSGVAIIEANDESISITDFEAVKKDIYDLFEKTNFEEEIAEYGDVEIESPDFGIYFYFAGDDPLPKTAEELFEKYLNYLRTTPFDGDSSSGAAVYDFNKMKEVIEGCLYLNVQDPEECNTIIWDAIGITLKSVDLKIDGETQNKIGLALENDEEIDQKYLFEEAGVIVDGDGDEEMADSGRTWIEQFKTRLIDECKKIGENDVAIVLEG